jgi:hypothetical protein
VIANGETPEGKPLFTGAAYFDVRESRAAFERSVKSGFANLCRMAARLRSEEANWPKRWAQVGYGPTVHLEWETPLSEFFSGELRVRLDGQLEADPTDPRAAFVRVLEGAELQRFRTCAVCNKFLYAVRSDQKACSAKCATALRVRRWRADQTKYEQTRKFKTAGVTPEVKR